MTDSELYCFAFVRCNIVNRALHMFITNTNVPSTHFKNQFCSIFVLELSILEPPINRQSGRVTNWCPYGWQPMTGRSKDVDSIVKKPDVVFTSLKGISPLCHGHVKRECPFPWRPGAVECTQADASTMVVADRLLSSVVRGRDDSDWPVHLLMNSAFCRTASNGQNKMVLVTWAGCLRMVH